MHALKYHFPKSENDAFYKWPVYKNVYLTSIIQKQVMERSLNSVFERTSGRCYSFSFVVVVGFFFFVKYGSVSPEIK